MSINESKEINKLKLMHKCLTIADKLGHGDILHKSSDGCGGGNIEYSDDILRIYESIGYYQNVDSLEVMLIEDSSVVFRVEVIGQNTIRGHLPIVSFKNDQYNVITYSPGEWLNKVDELYADTKGKKSNVHHKHQKYHEIRPGVHVCFD